jgi:cytochrome c-type biogenesis protein CcmH/NrfF
MTINFDVNNIVRSLSIAAVALPMSLSLTGLINVNTQAARENLNDSAQEEVFESLREKLTMPCVNFRISKADSKLEREAKNEIDEVFGGDVAHASVCNFILS